MSKNIISKGTCPGCGTKLPDFKREGSGWGIIDCTTCSEWFDVYKYLQAGGIYA